MNKNGAVGDGNSQLIEVLPARFAGTRTDEPKKFTIQVALDGKHFLESPSVVLRVDNTGIREETEYAFTDKEDIRTVTVNYKEEGTGKALAKPDDTALVSIFVPGELLTAAGITPYSVEAMSCFIAGTRCEQAFLAQTESEGFPETMCSYHRVFLGAALTGILPAPKCMIYTNLACDGNMITFPYLKEKYSCPGFYIDVSYEKTHSSIKYVANQLKELKHFLEDITE